MSVKECGSYEENLGIYFFQLTVYIVSGIPLTEQCDPSDK